MLPPASACARTGEAPVPPKKAGRALPATAETCRGIMHLSRRTIITTLLLLAFCLAGALASSGAATAIFTGKIQEIRKATALGLGKRETFYTIKLDTKPKYEFRFSEDDAVSYGLVDAAGPSMVVTPKMKKGLGWKVTLTCDGPTGSLSAPVYRVKALKRLDN
jgi:hypothetical protein